MDKRIKCTACKRVKFEEDFIKNQKILKTCIGCREKKKTDPTKDVLIEVPKEVLIEVPKEVPIEVPKEVPAEVPKEVPKEVPSRWIGISGHWIHQGDEQKLHKKLMRKVNRQFHQHCAFPVHKYLTRWVMVDIRDRYIG